MVSGVIANAIAAAATAAPELTPAQLEVLEGLLQFGRGATPHALATLAGYAGVGKTTVVAALVAALASEDVPVVVLAPTHKALSVLAQRLGSHPDVEAMTVQSALALKIKERPDGLQDIVDEGAPGSLREFAFAVVDEASMISEGMLATLISKRGRCRVLFVGDPAQLPPVDGNGATSPVFGAGVPLHWQLTEVVRQARENPIIRLATTARRRIVGGAEFGLRDVAEELAAHDGAFVAIHPGGVAEVSRLVADAIAHGQDTRALAWDNASVQAINASVHALAHPGRGEYPDGTQLMAQDRFTAFRPGTERMSQRVNVPIANSALLTVRGCEPSVHPDDPNRAAWLLDLELDGGETARCWVAADQRQLQVDIGESFGEYRRLKLREQSAGGPEARALRDQAGEASRRGWALKARYAPVRYAYAMTVHKAQGSTFDAVVLDWASFERCRDVQLRNRLIYVALTRTRRFAVVCA